MARAADQLGDDLGVKDRAALAHLVDADRRVG
jgi:hypothetical protein